MGNYQNQEMNSNTTMNKQLQITIIREYHRLLTWYGFAYNVLIWLLLGANALISIFNNNYLPWTFYGVINCFSATESCFEPQNKISKHFSHQLPVRVEHCRIWLRSNRQAVDQFIYFSGVIVSTPSWLLSPSFLLENRNHRSDELLRCLERFSCQQAPLVVGKTKTQNLKQRRLFQIYCKH